MGFVGSVRTTALALFFMSAACLSSAALASQATADQEKVVEAMRLMYIAATNDDMDQFSAVTSPDFYTFDGGKRMTGEQLMGFIKDAHAAGKVYVWEVTEPKVYVDGQTAWITYVNRGSLQDDKGRKELIWLESAVLRRDDGTWRIQFFHSTRVPTK